MKRVLLMLTSVLAASAHEIGSTRVAVLFDPGGTFEIEVVADASNLVEKLEAVSGNAFRQEADARVLQSKLAAFGDLYRKRIKVEFDGKDVQPDVAFSVAPAQGAASAAAATIRLSGRIPTGARRFNWTYGWTFTSYALTLRSTVSGMPVRATEWLEGNQGSAPFSLGTLPPTPSRLDIARRYLMLGFTHIVPLGFDHVLFVLGIFLLSRRPRSMLLQISAFTVAHSITLALCLYGLVSIPGRVVEPLIAVSIAYVAIENIFLKELKSWRVALVFAFGLLHGMGFAGALKEVGLPRSEFLTALVTFNIGVEAGQLAVILVAFLSIGCWYADRAWYRSRIVIPTSAAIACLAVYWTFERTVGS